MVSSICKKTPKAKGTNEVDDNRFVLCFEAFVSHNLAAFQFMAHIMGRCLLTVRHILVKANIMEPQCDKCEWPLCPCI